MTLKATPSTGILFQKTDALIRNLFSTLKNVLFVII